MNNVVVKFLRTALHIKASLQLKKYAYLQLKKQKMSG